MTSEPFASDLTGRRVRMDGAGEVSVLYLDRAETAPIGPGQVVVRVHASGINPGEAKIRDGSLEQRWPSTFPQGQGSDLAGTIVAVGSDLSSADPGGDAETRFAIGDEVFGWTDDRGAQADYVTLDADHLVAKPDGLGWLQAGALYVVGATAWSTLDAVDLAAGDTIAVSGASGGVGHLVVQLAGRRGARVLAIAGPDSAAWLRGYGAEPVTYGDGLADRLRELAPDGIDAFVDTSGAGYLELAVDLGVRTDRIDTIADFEAAGRLGVQAQGGSEVDDPLAVLAELAELVADGSVQLRIESVYPLEQVREAYTELAEGHTHGKIVLDLTMNPTG